MVILLLGWLVLVGLFFEYLSIFKVVFWNHLFYGLLLFLQVFCCCEGSGLSSSFHVEADLLGISMLSCFDRDRLRGKESPFFVHGELTSEVAAREINGGISPIDVRVVSL